MTSRDERVEAFLQDALSLQDERLAQVREGVRIYIARYEKDFPDLDIRALCRKRVREEMDRCKGTSAEGHLQIVLDVLEGSELHRDADEDDF
jgi:hypothetical protein